MYGILLVIHVLIAISLVTLILIQQGKGAQAGAAFGSGASQTVFGSQGSGNFISRTTGILAGCFFAINLIIATMVNRSIQRVNPMQSHAPSSVQQEDAASSDVPFGND